MSYESQTEQAQARLSKGTRVQVRNQFDGAWTRGFEVHGSRRGGYVLRRLSDKRVLPATFPAPDLRQEPFSS